MFILHNHGNCEKFNMVGCYVICQTGNTLLGSLVRLPDNHLDVSESERVLRHEEKFTELVDLFRSKQMHRQGIVYCTDIL